jgi:hypothetical protein
MKNAVIAITVVMAIVLPALSYGGTDNGWAACSRSNAEIAGNEMSRSIVLASDSDQPCYAGGKYLGNCPRTAPYHHVFNGTCYATLDDCKKADGDLSTAPGSGGCVRCGR